MKNEKSHHITITYRGSKEEQLLTEAAKRKPMKIYETPKPRPGIEEVSKYR